MACRRALRLLARPYRLHCRVWPQGNIKRDPASYSDEFGLQWRHYKACLQLFLLKPSQDSQEFAELVTFIAQVQHQEGDGSRAGSSRAATAAAAGPVGQHYDSNAWGQQWGSSGAAVGQQWGSSGVAVTAQ